MAMVSFKKGLLASLPATYSEGTFYVTTDERAIYLDVSNEARIRLGDFQEFATVTALNANANPSTSALYYVTDINCLAKWNGSEYIQINRDTGMTSVEVTGSGNAVTAAVYSADGRKLTLTKGAAFATREYVGEIPTGYAETNVVAYVNKKAEEVLAQATGGSSESAASVLAALNTYKAENDPKVTQAQADIEALEEKVGEKAVGTQIDEKITALDLPNTYDAKGAAAAAEQNAKTYADDIDEKLTTEVDRAKAAEAQALADAKAYADEEDAKIEAVIGEVETGKTVVQMISEAKTAATYDDSALKARVEANEGDLATLKGGAETAGSVDYKIAQAVAAIMENPDETMNSINELVTWCNDHAADALELSNKVSTNETDIAALEGLVGSTAVATQITDAIAAALKIEGVDKYALATDLTAAIARIAALEGKSHEHANKALLDTYTQTEADLADAVAKKHEHANKAELDKIVEGDKAKWDAAQANAEKTAADALAGAKTELEGKITAAQTASQTHADGLNTAMDTRVKALEEIDHEAYKGYADQAEADAKAHTETLLTWGSF